MRLSSVKSNSAARRSKSIPRSNSRSKRKIRWKVKLNNEQVTVSLTVSSISGMKRVLLDEHVVL